MLLHDSARRIAEGADAGRATSTEERGALRAAMCHAARVTREVVTAMYELGSSSSLYTANRLERIFRDGHAAAQHGLLNPINLEPAGRILLGRDLAVPIF